MSALKEVNLNGGTMSASGINGLIFIDPETLNITSDAAYAGQDNIYALANNINVKKGVSLVKENGNLFSKRLPILTLQSQILLHLFRTSSWKKSTGRKSADRI